MANVFSGELWSYEDARRRAPEAWKIVVISGNGWERIEFKDIAPKALGHFERHQDGKHWVYVAPNGYARPVNEQWSKAEPPALPKSQPIIGRKCGCGKVHVCHSCGQAAWIEIHGVADGYCTYCYSRG